MSVIILKTWRYDDFSSSWIPNKKIVSHNMFKILKLVRKAKELGFRHKICCPKPKNFSGAK